MKIVSVVALLGPAACFAADCVSQRTSNGNPDSRDLAAALLQDLPDVCNGGSPAFPPLSNTVSTFNSGQEVWNVSRTDPSIDVSSCSAAFTNIIVQCISDPSQSDNPGSWGGAWSLNGATFTLSNPGAPGDPIAGFYRPNLTTSVQSAGQNVASMNSDPFNPDWAAAAAILFLAASAEATALSLVSLASALSSAASVALSARQAPGPQAAASLASAYSSASASAQATTSPTSSTSTSTSTSSSGPTTSSTSSTTITTSSTTFSTVSTSSATSSSSSTDVTTTAVDASITFPISLDACPLYTPEWSTTDPGSTVSSTTSTSTSMSTTQATATSLPAPGCNAAPFNAIISSVGYSTNGGLQTVNDLLYSLRQVLCNNDCTYPPDVPTADAYVYPPAGASSNSPGECELSIGLEGGIEVFAYRHTPATGAQQQDCWDALDSVIKNCVKGRQAEGWVNGASYEFFKAGVRTNNDPEALHPKDFYHDKFNYLIASGKGGSTGAFINSGLQG